MLKLTIQIFREEDGGVGLSHSPREDRERPPMTGASVTQPAPPFMSEVSYKKVKKEDFFCLLSCEAKNMKRKEANRSEKIELNFLN